MDSVDSESAIWQQIDTSERYLLSCMFEEASSLASSVIWHICTETFAVTVDEAQLSEMKESAGMVFVQSLKELGRTSELFIELQTLFGSLAAIPVLVFLTGASMQISEGYATKLRADFEQFLGEWKYMNDEVYVLPKAQSQSSSEICVLHSIISADKYVEMAELYAITLLGMVLCRPDLAISWIEKADLPQDKRQEIIVRVRSLRYVDKGSLSSPGRVFQRTDGSACSTDSTIFDKESPSESQPNRDKSNQDALKSTHPSTKLISDRLGPYFWWFHTVRLKFGSMYIVLPRGRTMILGLLIFSLYRILKNRRAAFKRIVAQQASSIWRILSDALQLAFSFQVNPLAAVQPTPSAPLGSR
ncbi:hypothetical protein J5N97_026692 [Dioscorea zingiberensis]|uniref:Uncharacterized protein n=1 Tax=Dioscorea zingiberensis TaxID=325984 RepID=A0A9D5H6Y2_9LILI|nr:hypothetical protein J5N97_026692 [Dioscorea zingiberensis]